MTTSYKSVALGLLAQWLATPSKPTIAVFSGSSSNNAKRMAKAVRFAVLHHRKEVPGGESLETLVYRQAEGNDWYLVLRRRPPIQMKVLS